MGISATSSGSNYLQQLTDIRHRQDQVDAAVAESMRQARQQVVEQNLQDASKQVERVNEIKQAGIQARGGSIDVWA